jgi:hypothetical protein
MTKPPKARPCMLRLSGETTGRQQSDAIRRNQANQVQSGAIRCNQAQPSVIRLRQPASGQQAERNQSAIAHLSGKTQSDAIRRNQTQSERIRTCRERRNQTQSERIHSHTCRGRRRSPLDASASQPRRGDQAWVLASPWQRRRHGAAGARTAGSGLGGQVISNQRFCLRRRNLRSWEKPLCFRTGCIQASKRSSIFSVRTALHRRQFSPCSFDLVWPARAQALARAHPGIHKRTLCGCSYWESSRVELLAIQQSVKIFAVSMLDIPPARACARES